MKTLIFEEVAVVYYDKNINILKTDDSESKGGQVQSNHYSAFYRKLNASRDILYTY